MEDCGKLLSYSLPGANHDSLRRLEEPREGAMEVGRKQSGMKRKKTREKEVEG